MALSFNKCFALANKMLFFVGVVIAPLAFGTTKASLPELDVYPMTKCDSVYGSAEFNIVIGDALGITYVYAILRDTIATVETSVGTYTKA